MKATHFAPVRVTVVAAGLALALAATGARAENKPLSADAFPAFDSYIKLSGMPASIAGNSAAFQERAHMPDSGAYGIEDLHLARDLQQDTTVEIDGRALTGAEDYLGKLKISKNEVGTFETGYKTFRTFYDGVGGFFPLSKQFLALTNQELKLDRGKFWAEAVLTVPGKPVVTVSYVNETRSGKKDSTIWGSSDFTGLPFNLAPNPVNPARKMSPSYIDVDEKHQEFELTAKHTFGNTTLQFAAVAESENNLDTRLVTNFPGEVIPWSIASLSTAAQPAAKAKVGPENWNNQQAVRQSDGIESHSTAFTGKAETVINDKFTLSVAGSYQLLHADLSGDRPLLTNTPTSAGAVPIATATFSGLTGRSRVKVATGNIALDIKPTPDLFVKVALRSEREYISGASAYSVLSASGTPAVNVAATPRQDWAKIHQDSTTPVLEARYTGIKNLSLYFTGSLRDLSGVEKNTSAYNPLTAANGTLANNNLSEDHGNFTLGANWRATNAVTVRAEVFRKHHQFDSVGFAVNTGDNYQLDSDFTGVKLTSINKFTPALSATTRYVYQSGKMQVTGYLPTYPAYDSCDAKNHTISETIDWSPNASCYVQLNGNLVLNTISTVYPRAGITPATSTVNAYSTNQVLQDADNNYATASLVAGCTLDKRTDVSLECTYYRANNGNAFAYALMMPYGMAVKETVVAVGAKHKLSDKLMLNAKLGYMDSMNDTTGGNTNFRGPVGYLSFDYAL
ncbi:MAG TPA: hypothetical protein VG936_02140 [Lacunisphaera sp.]|nr:hypothetical protein [Lacunisphaera sp.]